MPERAGSAGWWVDESNCHRRDGVHCWIWIDRRPAYCDRGAWLAHVEVSAHPRDFHLDHQDGWPRYYFDLDRAKAECEAWLQKRSELA
jgi:hypothetical protein